MQTIDTVKSLLAAYGSAMVAETLPDAPDKRLSGLYAEKLVEAVSEIGKDAERYRWLRKNTGEIVTSAWDCMQFYGELGCEKDAQALDAAVDAAMQAERCSATA